MLRTSAVLFVWRVPAQALLGRALRVPSHGVCCEFPDGSLRARRWPLGHSRLLSAAWASGLPASYRAAVCHPC